MDPDDEPGGTSDGDDERGVRAARPAAIELAGAILIVGGVLGMIGAFATSTAEPAGLGALPLVTIILSLGQMAAGLLVRIGRLWIVAINYVAVLAFLDLLAAGVSSLSLMLGVAEVIVVVILLWQRPWFEALGRWRSQAAAAASTRGPRLSP